MAWSLEEAQKYLKQALDAREKILKSQEYTIDGRRQKRAELESVNEDIRFWQKEVIKLKRGNLKIKSGSVKW